jgi:hypothetical protein
VVLFCALPVQPPLAMLIKLFLESDMSAAYYIPPEAKQPQIKMALSIMEIIIIYNYFHGYVGS